MKPSAQTRRALPKGSVLIVSLWAVVFFGIVSIFVSARTNSQVNVIKRFKHDTASRLASSSGVSYALDVIRKRQTKVVDSQAQAEEDYFWFENPETFKEIQLPGQASPFFRVGHKTAEGLVVGMADESARININKADESIFTKIYMGAGGEAALNASQAEALARATTEWRDRKEPFLEFGHALEGDHSGFGCVEELLVVPGMTLPLWNALKDRLTVYGKGLNLNTVSKETLLLVGISDSLAERIISTREGGDTSSAEEGKAKTAGERPYSDLGDLEQKIGVSSEEDAALQEFSSFWIFDVDTFRFLSLTWMSPEDQRPGTGVECVAILDGQLLTYREISFVAELSQVSH